LSQFPRNIAVVKYGGSSVSTVSKIRRIANQIVNRVKNGEQLIVVVSAMGNFTDELLDLSRRISSNPSPRELDMLLTAGERISASLLSIAINELGVNAVSFSGYQVGILTDDYHTNAKILEIKGGRLEQALKEGKVPVVAGFQGISEEDEETTLGRGGSDTTAVALAQALDVGYCEIYTDVEGVYTENPREFKGLKMIPELSHDEMFELSSGGAGVLHARAAALAAKYGIKVIIKSSFGRKEGTIITNSINLEKPFVRGITHLHGLSLFTILDVPQELASFSEVLTNLAKNGVRVKFFLQGIPQNRLIDLSIIIADEDFEKASSLINSMVGKIRAKGLALKRQLGSFSLVGPGIGNDTTTLSRIFKALGKKEITVEIMNVSELNVTCVVANNILHTAVETLLTEFNLKK